MRSFIISLVASTMLVGTVLASKPAQAQTPALTFTGGVGIIPTAITYGWRFQVTSTVTVTGLGFWDSGADGLGEAHPVGIWTDTGTLLTNATVPAGTVAPLISGFRQTGATTTLVPGIYRIGAFSSASSTDAVIVGNATATTIPEITYLDRAFEITPNGTGLAFVDGNNTNTLAANFGPTFFIGSATEAPEPGSLALLGMAALSGLPMAGMVIRRRKAASRA